MRSFAIQPVRRLMMMTLAAMVVMTTAAAAQDPQTPPPAAEAPAQPDPFKFTTQTAIVFNLIKPEKTADFEAVWTEIKAGLAASEKPELKQQAANFKMFKLGVEMPAGDNRVYIFYIDPVPNATFDPTKVLYESGAFERAKADELYAKLKDCYAQIVPYPLVAFGG